MCDLKKVAAQDSRNIRDFADAIGWDWLEEEAKTNVDNPSRAMRKAAIAAATWYAGGALGGAAGGGAGNAAGTAANVGVQGASDIAPYAAESIAQSMAQFGLTDPSMMASVEQVLANGAEQGGGLLSGGQQGLMPSSMDMAPVVERSFNANQVPVTDMSKQAGLLDKARFMMSKGGPMDAQKMQMGMAGMNMMSPEQPQMQMPPPRPMQNQQEGPLPAPYNQGVAPGQNSLGLLGKDPSMLSEEEKKRLRMMGVKI